ncbi:hypothetical protein QVD17_10795 [Tagetes erecta]|uniref:Uncharacterized protein n=1 Tax=Tagetes erecta TaxID=13708 RepID=A0AAD8P6I7_TARER|nr:hypothetical protein QVD17_10795 [Tagetes erecta]
MDSSSEMNATDEHDRGYVYGDMMMISSLIISMTLMITLTDLTPTPRFHALRAEWRGRETRPLRAFQLISGVFFDLYNGLPPPTEAQGFFEQYGLPTYQNIAQSIDVFNGLKPTSSLKNMKKFPTYDLNLLVDNLNNFSTNPEILRELNKRLSETTEVLIEWFYALRKAWTFTNPKTPEMLPGL